MKPRQILILGIILGILIVGVVFQKLKKPPELQTEEYSALDFNFDPANVSKIVIQKNDTEKYIEATKENSVWKLTNFHNGRGDLSRIDNFLKQVKESKGELRATDKSLFSDFKITDSEATQVILSDVSGKPISEFYLGANSTPGATFIRMKGSDSVYFVKTDLYGAMNFFGKIEEEKPKPEQWAALKPLEVNPDDLKTLELKRFTNGNELVTASIYHDGTWKYTRTDLPFSLDFEKTKQFVTSIANWFASKALDPTEKDYGFSKPALQMKMITKDQAEILVTVARETPDAKDVYVQFSNEPLVYRYASQYYDAMNTDDSKFFATNPMNAEVNQIEKLNINTPKQKLSFSPKEKTWESLTNYVNNDVKNLNILRLLFEPAEQKKTSGKYSLELIQPTPVTLQVGEMLPGDSKEYAAKLSTNPQPFAISESSFKALFENLERLKEASA